MNRPDRRITTFIAIALFFALVPLLNHHASAVVDAQAPPDISLEPRVEDISSLVWQGSFRLSGDLFGSDVNCGGLSCATFAYGGTALGFRHDAALNQDSLFMVGHDQGQLATEVGVPALSQGPALTDLSIATVLQLFSDPTEGRMESVNPGSGTQKKIGGLFVYQDKLYTTVFDFYDGASTQLVSHFVSSPDLSIKGDVVGPQRVKYCIGAVDCLRAGYLDGYFGVVPPEWQGPMGGPVLNGNCCLNVISRTSWGPAVFTIDPAQLGVPDATGQLPDVFAQPLVYYFSDGSAREAATGHFHALAEDVLRPADPPYFGGNDACHNTSALFNCSSEVRGVVWPQGTRSVLFFGRQGLGSICYGQGTSDQTLHGQPVDPVNQPDVVYCFDPADHNKGFHAWPYAHYVWAYDANDMRNVHDGVVMPWDIKPYKVFQLNLPLDTPYGVPGDTQSRHIGGAAYDPATGRIFVSQTYEDGRTPVIHVFKLDLGLPTPPPPTPVASALTSPVAGSTLASSQQLFAWDAGVSVTRYKIDVGTTPGGSDIFAGTLGIALQQLVTGLPTDGSTVNVRLSSEINGALQFADYTFVAFTNHAPVVSPIAAQTSVTGTAVTLQVIATDQDGDPLSYAASNLPTGLTIGATGAITGTPTVAGDFTVTITATDGLLKGQASFVWHVTSPTPPPPFLVKSIVNPGPRQNREGDGIDLAIRLVLTQPTTTTRIPAGLGAFSATGLPGGLMIDPRFGHIIGRIAVGAASATPYHVTVSFTETVSKHVVTTTFDWTVTRRSTTGGSRR